MILENLKIEVETRCSDLIELSQKKHLQSAFIKIFIDMQSVIDSIKVEDLS